MGHRVPHERKRDYPALRDLLQRLEIPYEEQQAGKGFCHPAHFAYDENLNEIRPALQGLVDKLAGARIDPR